MLGKEIATEIKYWCYNNEIKFVGDYSGRFMYDRECVGIICKPIEKYTVIAGLSVYLSKQLECELAVYTIREDNMGNDVILYFPDISL